MKKFLPYLLILLVLGLGLICFAGNDVVQASTGEELLLNAEPYCGQLNMNSKHYNDAGILLQSFDGNDALISASGIPLNKDIILNWGKGNLKVSWGDCLARQCQSVTEVVYGKLGLNIPADVVTADGNPRFIIKPENGAEMLLTDLSGGVFWIPLTGDSSRTYDPLKNPLQHTTIAWRTAGGWQKVLINPVTEAEAVLDIASPNPRNNELEIHESQYDANGNLYLNTVDQTGYLLAADNKTVINRQDFLRWSTGAVTVHYADAVGNQQQELRGQTVYGNLGLKLPPEASAQTPCCIMKLGQGDAFFGGTEGGCFWIPLTVDNKEKYDYNSNPLQNAVIAWKDGSGGWFKLSIIPLGQAEQVLATASYSCLTLNLDDRQFNAQGQLYQDAVKPEGILKAKDGTTIITIDNLLNWSSGRLRVNFADTLSTQIKAVAGQNVCSKLGLKLPAEIVGEDINPRCIIKRKDRAAYFGGTDGVSFWIPLTADDSIPYQYNINPLQESTIAWRTDNGWRKIDIIPVLEEKIPVVINKFPSGSGQFDENDLRPVTINGDTRYFVQTVFNNSDNMLLLSDQVLDLLGLSQVYAAGGSQASVVDTDLLDYAKGLSESEGKKFVSDYIFKNNYPLAGQATLFLPVNKLRPGTTYTVNISSGVVYYSPGQGNEPVIWTFSTMETPQINDLSLGTVGEDYDDDEPLIIEGDSFYTDDIQVKFNSVGAEKVVVKKRSDGSSYLEVYLPAGRNRLEPGIYDVTVINNHNANYQETLYGKFSVVQTSDGEAPRDNEKTEPAGRYGDLIKQVKLSQDTLLLKSNYRYQGYVSVDLDEIMGEEVLIRKIKFGGSRWWRTSDINTRSKWADICLLGVSPKKYYSMEDVVIQVGRAEPALAASVGKKIPLSEVRSDFIEVGGENLQVDAIEASIPYRNSNGDNLQVLRYDEDYRTWYEQSYETDYLNKRVKFKSDKLGIFVVVAR